MAGMAGGMLAWGFIFLIGMFLTHFSGVDFWTAWIVWLIIIVVGNIMWMKMAGKTMKMNKEISGMWTMATVLGAILTIAYLMNLIPFDGSQVMAIWFFLTGAPMIAGGIQMKKGGEASLGLVLLAFGIITPGWFIDNFFLIGGILFGIPAIIGGLMMMKKK